MLSQSGQLPRPLSRPAVPTYWFAGVATGTMPFTNAACTTLPAFPGSSCLYQAALTASMSALVRVMSFAWSFFSLRPHDQRRITDASVPPGPLALPRPKPRRVRRRRLVVRAGRVIGIAGRVDAGDALAAAHELDERGLASIGRRLARSSVFASRKHPVVLERKMASYCFRFSAVKTAGSHVTCRTSTRPSSCPVPRPPSRPAESTSAGSRATECARDQDLVRLCRLGRRGRGQRRHHLLDIARARRLSDRWQIAATATSGSRWRPGRTGGASTAAWRRRRGCGQGQGCVQCRA